MPRLIPDNTGRFAERPHYDAAELDRECEETVRAFLIRRHGAVRFPIETDDLEVLIEETGAWLDTHADLSRFGDDVEGVAEFFPGGPPLVCVSAKLATDLRRQNRRRTTLAHEFGHVHFHDPLFQAAFATGELFARDDESTQAICSRSDILGAPAVDWMEWQAGYVSGAILMPVSRVREVVGAHCERAGLHGAVQVGSQHGAALLARVMKEFAVSADAARIRLLKLGLLTTSNAQTSLFGWNM